MQEVERVKEQVLSVIEKSKEIKIKDQESLERANTFLGIIKSAIKEVKNTFDPIVSKAKAVHTESCSQRSKYLNPLIDGESKLKYLMSDYSNKKEREEAETRRRAQEEADKKEAEKKAKIDAQIKKAKEEGDKLRVQQLKEKKEDVYVETKTVVPKITPIKGVAFKKSWKGELVDIKLLAKEVVEGRVDETLLQVNQVALNNYARIVCDNKVVPGLKIYCKKEIARR